MRLHRLVIPILLALVTLFVLWAVALAQEPEDWHPINDGDIWWDWDISVESGDSCTDGTDDNCQRVNLAGSYYFDSYQNFYLPVEASAIRISASKSAGGGIDFGVTGCGHIGNAPGDYTAHSWTSTITCSTVMTAGWYTVYWANNTGASNTNIYSISMEYYGASAEEEGGATCTTVDNSHFLDTTQTDWLTDGDGLATGNWLLDGDAAITSSNLSLSRGGSASQRLSSILPNISYQAVISVSSVITQADILLTLGNGSQIVTVSSTGTYTVTLKSPINASETTYTLENVTGFAPGSDATIDIDFTCVSSANDPIDECTSVPNGGFDDTTEWVLSHAVITDGLLTIDPYGSAQQNLSLDASTSYGGVISITNVLSDSSPSLEVTIDEEIVTIDLTGAGSYQFAFTTTNQVYGPVIFSLENPNLATIDVDAVCVYAGTTNDGSGGDCIAPLNGDFDAADGWTYMRGAEWYSPAKEASLPYADTALVASTSTYSLPTISTGEHLLLSFTSRKYQAESDGGIMGRVKSGVDSASFTYEVYPTEYTFETSLDYLAGHSDTEIAFVNPGLEGSLEFSGTADISLDNVCIFVANRGPVLPAPTDPNALPPVDLGFNYTSCDEVDGILAWFRVNIQQYRADYLAGTSIWDPIGWVPWLISAMWNILATWLCIFMAAFVTLVDILEYLINNFLNIGNWLVRSWPIFATFLLSVWYWLNATIPNLWTWLAEAVILILLWLYLSGGNIVIFTAFMLSYFIQAALDFLSWLGFDLPINVIERLLNGLKAMANIFITGWNLFIVALGGAISNIISAIIWVWDLLVPVLEAVWGYISSVSLIGLIAGLIFGFSWSILGLLWMVFRWLWANVLLVIHLPLQLYYGFDQGTRSDAFDALITCADENFWCAFFAGVQIINQTVGQTILYPIVIAGIILATIGIFWRNIWKMFTIDIA